MANRPRLYETMLASHFAAHRQMALVAGPRQVGKTTLCRVLAGDERVLNWDNADDRATILAGPESVAPASALINSSHRRA